MGERGLWIGWMTMTVGSVIRVAGVVEAVVVAVEAVVEAAVAVAASAAVGMVGSAFPNRARIGVHRRAGVDLPIASHPPSTMSDDNTATNTDDTTTVTFGSSRAVPRAIKDPLERIPAANETTANPEEEEEGVPPSNRTTRTTTTSTEVGPPVPSGCPRTFRNRRSKTRLSSSGASPARRRVGEARPPRAERDLLLRRRRRRHRHRHRRPPRGTRDHRPRPPSAIRIIVVNPIHLPHVDKRSRARSYSSRVSARARTRIRYAHAHTHAWSSRKSRTFSCETITIYG